MRRLLRVLGWILGVLVVAWLGVCFLWGTATSSHQLAPKSRVMLGDWLGSLFVHQFWNWSFADAILDGRAPA